MYIPFRYIIALIFITTVKCDRNADLKCVSTGNAALNGLNDQQMYDLSQKNLNDGSAMVSKRVEISGQKGFNCYVDFYKAYIPRLSQILQTGLNGRLAKARTPSEKTGALKAVASLTQTMICDEKWRANHANDNLQCTTAEANGLIRVQFRTRLAALKGTLFLGGGIERIKNPVMASIITDIRKLYSNIYEKGLQCSQQQTGANKCKNLKKLVQELDRLFYLGGLSVQTKFLNFLSNRN